MVHDARGRSGLHHLTYRFALHDGRILRTRVSHPPDRTGYGERLWAHILRDQLQVDEATFWKCVRDGTSPDRGGPPTPAGALPADLVFLLIHRVGLTEDEVAGMTKEEAIARVRRYWETGD